MTTPTPVSMLSNYIKAKQAQYAELIAQINQFNSRRKSS